MMNAKHVLNTLAQRYAVHYIDTNHYKEEALNASGEQYKVAHANYMRCQAKLETIVGIMYDVNIDEIEFYIEVGKHIQRREQS